MPEDQEHLAPHVEARSQPHLTPENPADSGEKGGIRITDPDLPLVWPHQEQQIRKRLWRFPDPGKQLDVASRAGKQIAATMAGNIERQREVMGRLNGENAKVLADKYKFTEVLRQMGYNVPSQVLITADQSPEQRQQRMGDAEQLFPDAGQPVICKPYDGHGGIGIVEMSASDLPQFVESAQQDYIIQERVPIEAEVRYVRQVDARDGVIRRIYDEKEIPKVVGDGRKTKRELIREANVPWFSKALTIALNVRNLNSVVPEGGSVHISSFGVPHKDEAELEWSEGKRHRVENMDRFMRQFMADLQTKTGTQLPMLAFDIGVKDKSVLDGPYDFEAMKKNLVPFECQMPFSLWGYIARSGEGRRQKINLAKKIYGPQITGKKEDFLPEITTRSGEKGIHSTQREYDFGRGRIEAMRVAPDSSARDATNGEPARPIFFVQGFGQDKGLGKYLETFAQEGREAIGVVYPGRRAFKIGSRRVQVGENSVKMSRYQMDKAEDMITAMDAMGIEQADLVATSEGAFRAMYAAVQRPDKFPKVVLVHPAGMTNDSISLVGARVVHQFGKEALHGILAYKRKEGVDKREGLQANALSTAVRPWRALAEGLPVAYSRLYKLVPLMESSVSIAAGKGDVIYPRRRLQSHIREEDIFQFFETEGRGHGIGHKVDIIRQILTVLKDMGTKSKKNESGEVV